MKSVDGKRIIYRLIQGVLLFFVMRWFFSLRWDIVARYIPQLIEATWLTIQLTVLSVVFGFIIAVPLALLRVKRRPKWGASIADGYVALFRGTPLLVQLYLFYYGLGQFEWVRESFLWVVLRDAYPCAIFVFALNSGAYACEIVRGAMINMPSGQLEAAQSLGLSNAQVDWLIWIPSSLRRALPQYGNEMVFAMHGTALAALVSLTEVFGMAREINARHYLSYEGMVTAAMIYIVLTLILSLISKWMEAHYLRHQNL